MEDLLFSTGIDTTGFRRGMSEIRNELSGLTATANSEANKIDTTFKNIGLSVGAYFSGTALIGFTQQIIQVRGEFQKTEIAFQTMLGNKAQASQLMGEMVNLAAKTPFSLQEVSNGAKQLLAFQIPANEVVDTLTRMGNIAAGLSVPIERINLVYGQVKAKGKLMGDDLRQFTEAGIPMVAELAKKFGTSTTEITAMVSAGKIGFNDVKDVLFSLTNEGGMFFNLMEQQSKSLSGKISNLGDAFDQMLNDIGKSQEGALSSGIDGLAYLVENYKSVLDVIGGLVVAYGSYRAALMTISAIEQVRSSVVARDLATMTISEKMALGRALVTEKQAQANVVLIQSELAAANAKLVSAQADKTALGSILASNAAKEVKLVTSRLEVAQETLSVATKNASALSEVRLTAVQQIRAGATRMLTSAQALLNATMLSNPIVLVVMAVAGLVYAYFKLRDTTTALEKAEKTLAENRERNKKILDDLSSKTSEYLNVLRDNNATVKQQFDAYQKLLALYPNILKGISQETFAKMDLLEVNKLLAQGKDQKEKELLIGDIEGTKAKMKELKDFIDNFNKGVREPKDVKYHFTLDGYKEEYEGMEISLKKQQFLLNQRNQAEKIANMSASEKLNYYTKESQSLEKQLSQHKTKNKLLKDSDIITVRLGGSLANLSVGALNVELKKAQSNLLGLQNQLNSNKNAAKDKAFWEKQKSDAEAEIDKLVGGKTNKKSGEHIKKIREAEKELSKYDYSAPKEDKPKKEKSASNKRELAEVFSKGSIAELEKRITEWNNAIQRASDGKVKVRKTDKYGKEAETGQVVSSDFAKNEVQKLEEQKKKLQDQYRTKTFEEEIKETERQWKVRYILASKYGDEVAKKQFPDLKGESYFDEVTQQFKKLDDLQIKGVKLSDSDLAKWETLKKIIENLTGIKDPFTNFTEGLDKDLSTKQTSGEKIDYLETTKKGFTKDQIDNGYLAEVEKRIEAEKTARENAYNELLKQQQSYEEKSLALAKQYEDIKATDGYKNGSQADKDEIDQLFKKKASALTMDAFKASPEWTMAFGDMEFASNSALQRIQAGLEEFKRVKADTLQPTEMRELEEAIKRVKNAQSSNPFAQMISGFNSFRNASKNVKTALEELKKAQEEYNATLDKDGKETDKSAGAKKKLGEANAKLSEEEKKQAEARQKAHDGMQKGQDIFNAVGQGLKDLGDAFGGFDDATNDAIEDIIAIGSAAMDLGKSIASGDVAGMIKAGIKLIGSIAKALSGDKKKERNIKRQAAVLKELEMAYNDLAFATERALGSKKYAGQTDLIRNLEQQKATLQSMIATEQSKKESDEEKIARYKAQIQSINQSIISIKEGIVKDILQTDAVDAAQKVGDALVEAYGKGEDAVKSLEQAANDMVKAMLKNQMNLLLQEKMKPILDNMLKAMGYQDGVGVTKSLSSQQIAAFKAQIVAAGQSMQGILDGYSEIFEGLDGNAQGLKGDIKGITEKTAGALEAQINAMRIIQVDMFTGQKNMLSVMKESLTQLTAIESNTRNLIQIRIDMSEMNQKIKKALAGIP